MDVMPSVQDASEYLYFICKPYLAPIHDNERSHNFIIFFKCCRRPVIFNLMLERMLETLCRNYGWCGTSPTDRSKLDYEEDVYQFVR